MFTLLDVLNRVDFVHVVQIIFPDIVPMVVRPHIGLDGDVCLFFLKQNLDKKVCAFLPSWQDKESFILQALYYPGI